MLSSRHSSEKPASAETRLGCLSPHNERTAWKSWCRLCAKEYDESHMCVFPDVQTPSSIMDNALPTAIGKFFWVNMRPNDGLSTFVCLECHTLVTSLTQFTERVNKVQAMFCALQNTDAADLNEIRLQYGILDNEWEHIIKLECISDNKEFIAEKESNEECEWELEGENNKEEIETETFELESKDELKEEGNYSFELVRRGIKRKREDDDDDREEESEDEDNIISIGALAGETDESETHFIIENTEGTDELDDAELLRQLRGDDDENGEEPVKEKNQGEEHEEQPEDEKPEDSYEQLNLQEETLDENDETDENMEGEKSAQVNEIDSSSCIRKKRRGRQPKYNIVTAKDDAESEDDANENSQTSYKYDCSICHKKYKNPTSYRKHVLEKHNKEPDIPDFKCETCNKIYPTERQLEIHARSHLALEDKLDIPCPYCERKFTKVSVMRLHVQGIHENKKPYICDECGRSLKTLAALAEHKLVHTNDTPYECDVCQRGFKNKARLKVHLETHNDSSYICTECGLKLNTRRTLKMHMLVHSDAKRYKCDFCPAAFKRTKALKNHLILHTGMRPYKCNFCEKTFSNGSNCRSHKKKMHAQELAEEEALGKKSEAVTVPKLEELRSSTNVVGNPRKVQRHHGGLPLHMRQLLIAAEERAKRVENTKQTNDMQSSDTVEISGEETHTQSAAGSALQLDDEDGSEFIELNEELLKDFHEGNDDDDDDDDDDNEMVVYEVIAEI